MALADSECRTPYPPAPLVQNSSIVGHGGSRCATAHLLNSPVPVAGTTRGPPNPLQLSLKKESKPEPSSQREPENGEISDQEWEIRTGSAIYLLQKTLPDFFSTGLVSSLDTSITSSSREASKDEDVESIYSPRIRLTYTPVVPLPAPFPHTLQIEGLSMYMASSAFVRHTLNALYTDLHVTLTRVRVHGPRATGAGASDLEVQHKKHRSIREKSLFIGIAVEGTARVSGVRGGWEVNSTYTFSPRTGRVHLHKVDSIEPAPHQAVFDALRMALGKLGFGREGDEGTGASGVCRSGRS